MCSAWHHWPVGFGLTLAFELPIVWLLLRPVEPAPGRRLTVALFANLATHPLVWFFFPLLPVAYSSRVTISEVWAFAVEAWFYSTFLSTPRPARAVATSLLANATSFSLGWMVVTHFGRWLF
jgi:hypothetical protein